GGSWKDRAGLSIAEGKLSITSQAGESFVLADPGQFAGYRGPAEQPEAVLLVNHGLHVEIVIDRANAIGRDDPAGIADVVLEAALSTIQDCEDSVSTVDADDKVLAYRNWLGLMKGTLTETVSKG